MIISQPFDDNLLDTSSSVGISLLGSFRLTLGGKPASVVSESKSEQLLICLALANQHRMSRAQLLDLIWPRSDSALAGQALNSLNHHLNKLSSQFLNGLGVIVHDSGYYQLNLAAGVWVDVDHFAIWSEMGKRMLSNGDWPGGATYCEQALLLYQGDLCGDSCIQTVIEREYLRANFLDLLALMADQYHSHGDPSRALCHIQRLLAYDPCREDAHRQAMRCYVHLNQRAQALRQYRLCCQALALEFDAKPEPETVALFEQIRLDPAHV